MNEVSIFLATTALEDFWDLSGPMVFLSDACTRYSRKDVWQKLSQEVLQNPLLERPRYYSEYEYVRSFYERMLPQIAEMLNEIHGQKFSKRYWRIVVGVWLFTFIQALYERYNSVKNALEKYPDLTTILLDTKDFLNLSDTRDFALNITEDSYNLQLYSRIFTFLGKEFPRRRIIRSLPFPSKKGIKNNSRALSGWIGLQLAKFARVIGRQPFIPRHENKILFLMACRGDLWFDLSIDEQVSLLPLDRGMRKELLRININDHEFEKLFISCLELELPQIFIEGYSDFKKQVTQKYPFKPKAIWSATSWCWDESFKFWAAAQAEEGTILAGMQHGGNYGMDLIHPLEEHEIAISAKYYSWGWEDRSKSSIRPMPVTKYIWCKRLGADNHKNGVLLATLAFPRYFYRYNNFSNMDFQAYLKGQLRFVSHLSLEQKAQTRIRLFNDDYGWDCRERWDDFDPQVQLEDWSTKFFDSMKNCRLHVSDHLSSTFVDALVVGKPTILFWDPGIFKVRTGAEAYLDDLRRAGILYDTPEKAAAAVDQVYDDVESWWNEAQRQTVITKFCHRFARTSPTALKDWAEEISFLAQRERHATG